MPRTIKELIAEANRHGFAIGEPMQPSEAESQLLGDAYFFDESQTLYHFLKAKYFEALLEKRSFRLARLDCFKDDPDEGRLSDSNATQTSHLGGQLSQQLGVNAETEGCKQFINGTQRELTFIHCWFGNEAEDNVMWEQYGDRGCGVCLKTTVRRFQASFDPGKPFYPQGTILGGGYSYSNNNLITRLYSETSKVCQRKGTPVGGSTRFRGVSKRSRRLSQAA